MKQFVFKFRQDTSASLEVERILFFFWSKMLKSLDELSEHELKVEYEKAGLEGQFDDVECLIRLTIYLVKVGIDPFSFQFNVEEEIHKSKDIEDGCEALEEEPNSTTVCVSAVPSSWLADGMSAEQSLVSFPATLPGGSSLISDNARSALLSSSMSADVVSADSSVTRMKTDDSSVLMKMKISLTFMIRDWEWIPFWSSDWR